MFRIYEKIEKNGVYVIAEMSANHGGSIDNALEIVRRAADAGADCVKIQTYTADSITIDCASDDFIIHGGLWDGYKLYDLYSDAGTPYEWHEAIVRECEKCGIDFLSTPFDKDAVDFLDDLGSEAYKIASFELVDIPLIEYAASMGKIMIISTGMATESEITEAINACHRVGNNRIVLLKCCSEYPANWEYMHISNIPDMIEKFHVPVGLSDHSIGSLGAIVAVSLGASVIEKHVKLQGVSSADSDFSMEINEFANMVKEIHDAVKAKGEVYYGPSPGEANNMKFRRSLYVVRDIKAGDVIKEDDIRSIRPSLGMSPSLYKNIIGMKASRDLKAGQALKEDMIKGIIKQ